jgi:hypothetical protein
MGGRNSGVLRRWVVGGLVVVQWRTNAERSGAKIAPFAKHVAGRIKKARSEFIKIAPKTGAFF